MNIETKKDFFKENGYCDFSIKDVDVDFFNFLDANLACDEEKNLQHKFNEFRFDSDKIETTFKSEDGLYETAKLKKEELFKEYGDGEVSQCWYYNRNMDSNTTNQIKKGIHNIIKYFYGFPPSSEKDELQLTYYDKDCMFTPHSDGKTINLCSIIIYLNRNYDESNGGLLVLNDGYVVPEFGNCALMDLSTHDIKHGVTKVTGGPGRYAILAFPKPLENIKD
jgi:hypothetical protein